MSTGYMFFKERNKKWVLAQRFFQLPLPQWTKANFHGGFVIWSQVTLIGETNHDPTHVFGGRTAPLHSFQQGGVSAPLEVRSLRSKAAFSIFCSFSYLLFLTDRSDPLHKLFLTALLTISVPSALSWRRLTQSRGWGPLFLKTTFLIVDVPK